MGSPSRPPSPPSFLLSRGGLLRFSRRDSRRERERERERDRERELTSIFRGEEERRDRGDDIGEKGDGRRVGGKRRGDR